MLDDAIGGAGLLVNHSRALSSRNRHNMLLLHCHFLIIKNNFVWVCGFLRFGEHGQAGRGCVENKPS